MRMLVACRLPHVALRAARRLPFAANLPVLSIFVCRLPLGAWCLPFCLAAAVCPWSLGSVARRFPPGACSFPSAERFPPPSASARYSSYRRMPNLRCASCGVNAFETHITLRCNMRVTFVKRCIHTLETLHSLPSPCGAAHRHALVATRPSRLELPGLG